MLVAKRAQAWCQRCGTNLCGKEFGLSCIPKTVCVCAQPPRIGTPQRRVDRTECSSSFPLKKEPLVLSEVVELGPSISAETVKACALIGLHMMAAENALRSDPSPDLREMWKYGCPKSPVWSGDAFEGE